MNMITGYIASTEGSVVIDGHDILEEPEEAKKCIGYLPEQPPLYFDMTVLEYLRFVADLKKIPRAKKMSMIEEVMDMVKITDMKHRLIKNLSKGYRQRVGIAQAVLGYPEVIILDEPTVGLDPKQINEIRELIKGLKKKHTVILSSHILSEVSAVCDYVLIISHGKLVASDTPENLAKLAAGSNNLNMLIKGNRSEIQNALAEVEGIKQIKMEKSSEENIWNASLTLDENKDIREAVFYSMVKADCPILEMKTKRASLEEVFLELTENEKQDQAKDEKTDKKSEAAISDADMDTDTETDIAAEKDTESVADVDIETSAGSVNGPAEKEEIEMTAVYKRELKSYLTSMIGYLFIFFILVLAGIYFSAYQLSSAYPKFEYTMSALTFVFLISVPILTMRVLAEERSRKQTSCFLHPLCLLKAL